MDKWKSEVRDDVMVEVQEKILAALECRKAGRFDEAIAQYRDLLTENPEDADVKKLLGHTYREAGRLEEALQVYQELLSELPHLAAGIYTWIGALYRRLGRLSEAVDTYRISLEMDPDSASAYNNLGNVYSDMGEHEKAAEAFYRSVQLDPNMSVAYNGLGIACRNLNRTQEAFTAYKAAIRLNPAYPEPYADMGVMLVASEQYDQAEICFNGALQLNPRMALAYEGLGVVMTHREEFDKALELYRKAQEFSPNSVTIYNNMGNCLQTMERFDEAEETLKKAISIDPTFAMAYHNLGVTYGKQKRFADALPLYEKALSLNPDLTDSYLNRALIGLTKGDYETGWREYDCRFNNVKGFPPRVFRQPMWDGGDFTGKRLLVVAEQGFGDTLQFCRYLPLIKARGGTVVLETFRELMPLLSILPGVDEWRDRPEVLSDEGIEYDTYIYLMSVPRLFETRVETIPCAVNTLFIPQETREQWQIRLAADKNLKVGIAWASKSANPTSVVRSCRLQDFFALADIPGVTFYSLQKGEEASQAEAAELPLNLENLSPDIQNFTDTAAIIEQLDLVITVDTVVAHLAATLGKPTWIILPYQSDWRWMMNREDSPWYPSVRLFRQTAPEQWPVIFQSVRQALSAWKPV